MTATIPTAFVPDRTTLHPGDTFEVAYPLEDLGPADVHDLVGNRYTVERISEHGWVYGFNAPTCFSYREVRKVTR